MAVSTAVIDVVANFKNNMSTGTNSAKKAVDSFTKSVEKTKKEVDRLDNANARPKVTVVDRATSALNKIDRGLKSIGGKTFKAGVKIVDYATRPIRAIKNALFSVKGLVAAIGTALAANQLLAKPISLADSYTSAKIGFSNLMGEAGGQKMMDDLDAFAKATPFKTSGVIDNAQKMLAMGWNAEDIIGDMRIIGDAAAATGKMDQGLESIVRALSQIKTKGKLSTEELNQLSEAGIAAKAMLAEQLGYGTGDKGIAAMTKDLEKGLIGSEVAVQALLKGMQQFEGTMEKTANETVEGLKSQLEDTFEINVLRKWGQGLQDGAKRGLGSILKLLDSSEESLAKFGDTVYEIGKDLSNWAADKLEGTIDKILQVTNSSAFKDADGFGKVKILWDEVIAKPFGNWWDSTGQPWFEEKAKAAAKAIAKGIVEVGGETLKIGFSALFNSGPLGKAIAAGIGLKVASGVINGISTAKTLWGGAQGLIGATGNAMVGGSGLLGALASVGYKFGGGSSAAMYFGGNLAGTMSGGMAALTGAGAIAGGATAAYGLYSAGKDLFTAKNTDASTEMGRAKKQAYTNSGVLKGSGIAAGAATGAALGSVIPGLGTAIGALVGAGVGFLGGKWLGDREVKNYQELEKTTEAAKYNSQEMKDAIIDGSKSAEELDRIFERACSDDMVKRFGDIELSMEEIEKYAKNIVFDKQAKVMDKFASASQKAFQSLETFQSAADDMERLNFDMSERKWKIDAGIDVKLSKEEIEEVKARVQTFMDSAEQALSDSHYEFNVAVDVLIKDKDTKEGIINTGNSLYKKLQKDLNSANKKLEAQYEIALKDGVITADEQEIISKYQQKVTEIINKVSEAETEASFEIEKLKFTTGDLSAESFANLQSSLNTQLEDYIGQQDVALKAAVSDVKLQMKEDPENAAKYQEQIQALVDGYNTNIASMKARVEKVQLEGISEAFDGAGTVEQLQGAISALTEEGKNPVDLTFSDINAHLNMDESSLSEEEKANFTSVMKQALQSSVTGENALKPDADVQAELTADEEKLKTESSEFRSAAMTALQSQMDTPMSVKGTANLSLDWKITSGKTATVGINGSSKTLTASLTKEANGGYIDRPIQALIGEAGPEMIIPLSAERRARGKALWERAGRAMGLWNKDVVPNANGGLYGIGASRLPDGSSGENTESRPKARPIQVEVGGVNITIQSTGQGVQQDIQQNADTIAGQIADILQKAFQNMPITVEA